MKIQVFSDLHNERLSRYDIDPFSEIKLHPSADVVVLAGDIDEGDQATTFIRQIIQAGKPVVYVLGNHEGYHSKSWEDTVQSFRLLQENLDGFHLLERDTVNLDGILFHGATLWAKGELGPPYTNGALTDSGVKAFHQDFHHLKVDGRPITPQLYREWHRRDSEFLRNAVQKQTGAKQVVVVHHGAHPKSISQEFMGSKLNGWFCNLLPSEIYEHADLIIHGHCHNSSDYQVGKSRIVANPRGYLLANGTFENKDFNETLLIEI